jgi:hypothetical protein
MAILKKFIVENRTQIDVYLFRWSLFNWIIIFNPQKAAKSRIFLLEGRKKGRRALKCDNAF